MKKGKLIMEFQNPSPAYRSAPFWSWNEKIELDEVCRQLDLMKQGGYGGAFTHSRIGLITPYLCKEWMVAIKTAVEYAKKNGLLAYLYDEDRWPSGFAGGLVTKNRRNQQQFLVAKKDKKGRWHISTRPAPPNEHTNNLPCLDTLKKEAVAEFIKSTYQAYHREVGKEFGKTVPAIFTDEPNYIFPHGLIDGKLVDGINILAAPYTDELPHRFRKEYGYEIEPNYLSLFEEKGNWKKVRYHYWRLVAKLFQKNFGKQIYNWCKNHNIALTGHYLCEDHLEYQISFIGAAMPLYEYMQIPGVDHLGNNIYDLLALKQCSSVAHQLGKKRVISELFGCSGQNMSFLDRKWIGDWHFALGINFFCPHLWLYSMAGCRKRDFPPTLSYQQPYWSDNKLLEDYFARTVYLLSQGKVASDVLVLHPIESGFMFFRPQSHSRQNRELWALNDSFVFLLENLLSNHFGFDLGDETILEKYGRVSGHELVVEKIAYRTVVLPEMHTIRRSTLNLLLEFIKHGGKVIALKRIPELVEGEKDEKSLEVLAKEVKVFSDIPAILSELEEVLPERIKVKDGIVEAREVYLYRRTLSDKIDVIFLANINKKESQKVELCLTQRGYLEEWDAFTGNVFSVGVKQNRKGVKKLLTLPPGGSYLFLFHRDKKPLWAKKGKPKEVLIAETSTTDWKAIPLGLNSLTLDTCYYRIGNQDWQKPIPVLKIQQRLEESGKEVPIGLRFTFWANLKKRPSEFYIVLERPEQFQIKVNGHVLSGEQGFWIDIAFRKIDIKKFIRLQGKNVIELKTRFHFPLIPKTFSFKEGGTELESIYLLGDFAVKNSGGGWNIPLDWNFTKVSDGFWARNFVIVSPSEITPFSLTDNGYPFFAGRFLFSGTVNYFPSGHPSKIKYRERIFLQLIEPSAITYRIRINGKESGLIFLPPYRTEITGLFKKGKNSVEIEAATSLRNLLGPHHNKLSESLGFVGPYSFSDQTNWVDDYHLVPLGLKGIKIYRVEH